MHVLMEEAPRSSILSAALSSYWRFSVPINPRDRVQSCYAYGRGSVPSLCLLSGLSLNPNLSANRIGGAPNLIALGPTVSGRGEVTL